MLPSGLTTYACRLRLGSWSLAVRTQGPLDCALLAFLFKNNVSSLQAEQWEQFKDRMEVESAAVTGAPVGLAEAGHWRLQVAPQERACIHVLMGRLNFALQQLLLQCDVMVLHAAAVAFEDGECWLFVGPRGSGKTSLALALAQQGGKVLADDRIVLRRHLISGCNREIKLTPKSELFFFPQGLSVKSRDYQGLNKKAWTLPKSLGDPHVDYVPTRIFFPRVGSHSSCDSIPGARALQLLIEQNRETLAYAERHQLSAVVEKLACLLRAAPAAQLNLGPDLAALRHLRENLGG